MRDPESVVVEFVRGASPPEAAIRRASLSFIDLSLCMLGGAMTSTGRKLVALRDETEAVNQAAGGGEPDGAVPDHTLVHGALSHVLDCDDNHDTIGGHPSCVLIPALLDDVEAQSRHVQDLYVPYVVGLETMAAIARALGREPYARGWHTTCVYGVIGASTALARLHRVPAQEIRNAIGLACGMASGTKAAFGTEGKALQVGNAAASGIRSLALARRGFSAAERSLSGSQGLAEVLGVDSPRWETLDALGEVWESLSPGIVFKKFPCCASVHAAIEAALDLRQIWGGTGFPERLVVEIPAGRLAHVDRPLPGSGLAAKFSIQYAVAAAWLDGECTVAQFSDERVRDPAVGQVMRRVTAVGIEQGLSWSAARLTAHGTHGQRSVHVPAATGHSAAVPLTLDDLAAKARVLGVTEDDFHDLCRLISGNASVGDVRALLHERTRHTAVMSAGQEL